MLCCRCIVEDGSLNILMEFAERGELYTLIQKRKSQYKLFSEDEIMNFFVQIALAVSHIHDKNVLHRDLKSKNIFVNKEGLLKVGDFGIAKVLNSSSDVAKTAIGTPYYLSPEICEDKPYNQKSDVWALGCILYELTTLNHAFDGQSLPALVLKILSGKYPAISSRYSPKLKRLIDSMFRRNPKSRPTVAQMLNQAYVKQHVDKYLSKIAKKNQNQNQNGAPSAVISKEASKGTEKGDDANAASAASQRDKDNWFQEQEAALKEIGQALNLQKADPVVNSPDPIPKPPPTKANGNGVGKRNENNRLAPPAKQNNRVERRPLPVVKAIPSRRNPEPLVQPVLRQHQYARNGNSNASSRSKVQDPVQKKWSKKVWLNAQKEKDERFRLKAEAEAKKAAKSEALHAEIVARRGAKQRKEAEIKQHMAKHKSEMRKVKPRLSKDMLRAAGAAFAERQKGQLLAPNQEADVVVLEKVPCEAVRDVQVQEANVDGRKPGKHFPVVEIFVPADSNTRGRKTIAKEEEPSRCACHNVLPAKVADSGSAKSVENSHKKDSGTGNGHVRVEIEGEHHVAQSKSHIKQGNSGRDLALRVGIGQRIESLRVTLEDKIGEDKFISVYKYLRKIGQTDDNPEMETQAKLENILGNNNIQYAFLIHKLLMLEDSLY